MAITYEDALATLQSMFADPWNRENLDYILRNQKGHMENTVDLILRHGDKDPQILIDQLEAGINPSQTAVAADEALARQLSQSTALAAASAAQQPSRATGGKGKPTTLPDDFLRVPGVTPSSSTEVDDEALARMLQDQLFSEELSRNREFAHLARGRAGRSSATARAPGTAGVNPLAAAGSKINEFASKFTQSNRNNNNANNNNSNAVPQSPNVLDKVAAMGDNAKRRLQMLAAQFNAQHNPNSTNTSSAAPQQETRGLLDDHGDDNDNMELAARKDL